MPAAQTAQRLISISIIIIIIIIKIIILIIIVIIITKLIKLILIMSILLIIIIFGFSIFPGRPGPGRSDLVVAGGVHGATASKKDENIIDYNYDNPGRSRAGPGRLGPERPRGCRRRRRPARRRGAAP